ncbi:MAG: hypothetical protein NZ869_00585 [Thermoanaerobaculum sp.]|nr:hypothetical protein [Thermoanaerobaculum sp.]MDW7968682.1 hypothetical protein [Thermoanaerobaculum sp.]
MSRLGVRVSRLFLQRVFQATAGHRGLLLLLLVVAASRFGFLPRGPWEQDEALLAAGVVDFDPLDHMPHPPGFPLWVLLGRVVWALGAPGPLEALQMASALLSLLGVAAMFFVARSLVGQSWALAAATLAAFLPGVWVHAARGFSETPAAAVFFVALALWLHRGPASFPLCLFFLTAAALIRPPLAPWFFLVGLLWAWQVRQNGKSLLAAALASLALLLVTLGPLVLEAGGWQYYWESLITHAWEHSFLLGTEEATLEQIGWVKGLGGPLPALVFSGVGLVGWLSLRQRLSSHSFWLASLAGLWLVYLLLLVHNRTYPRYWVLALQVAAVLVVQGLVWVLRRRVWVLATVGAGTLFFSTWTYPALRHMRDHPLPVVEAFLKASATPPCTVVFQDELFSFRNFLARTGAFPCASLRYSELKSPAFRLAGERLFLVEESYPSFLSSSVSRVSSFAVNEPRAVALSQGRFLQAAAVENPVIVYAGGSVLEHEQGHPFVWLYPQATVLLPALSAAGRLTMAVELPPGVGRATVRAWAGDVDLGVEEAAGERALVGWSVPLLPERAGHGQVVPLRLQADQFRKLAGDYRPLALKVFFVSLEFPPWSAKPYTVNPEPRELHRKAVRAARVFAPERLGEGEGAWCEPNCTWELPVSSGRVGLWLSAPRPGGAQVIVSLGTNQMLLQVPPEVTYAEVPTPPEVRFAQRVLLTLSTRPYQAPNDPRSLGVVVHRLAFYPGLPLAQSLPVEETTQ